MGIWIIWLIVIGLLLIVEVLSQMVWSLCLAIGCVAGLVASLCGGTLVWQIILTAIASVAAYIILVPAFKKWHALKVDENSKISRTGMDALLGRTTIIYEEIRPDRPGRARIDGDNWQVTTSSNGGFLPRGTKVSVVGYDSIILFVEPE